MAGTILDRELNAGTRTRFAVATEADDSAIRRLLRENAMEGSVSLTLEREPAYFRGCGLAGAEDQTILAREANRLICMGRCTRRLCWIDGRATRVGYLAELRLDAHARGRFRILRDGYEIFRELQSEDPAEFYFTSIGTENERARRVLERGVLGMPRYAFLAELDTVLIAVPRRSRPPRLDVTNAIPADLPEILELLNAHGARHQLATVWTAENLRALDAHGLPLTRFLLLRERGRLMACGALWDQRAFRQTVIQRYAFPLSAARPLLNVASHLFGTPRLPRPGVALAHAFLSPLAFADGAEALFSDLLESFFPLAAKIGLDYLTLALPSEDARLPGIRRRFSTRTWRSRLYRVNWPEQLPCRLNGRGAAFLPDVSLL